MRAMTDRSRIEPRDTNKRYALARAATKKTTENSEMGTSRERNVAERAGTDLSYSVSLFSVFSLSVFSSVSVSQSVSFLAFLCFSPSFLRSSPSGLSSGVSSSHQGYYRWTTKEPTTKEEHTTSQRLLLLLLEPKVDCGPATLARARPEERKLPGPNHASAAIFYLRRESGVWKYSPLPLSCPPRCRSHRSSYPSLLPLARFQPHTGFPTPSAARSLARLLARTLLRPLILGAFRRARTRTPAQRAPPAAWTTTSSYRFLRHSASRHSCQINNARAGRAGGFLATAAGVETASRCENPFGWG
jgi:hypothetical protein